MDGTKKISARGAEMEHNGRRKKKKETSRHYERRPRTDTEILHKVLFESRKCRVCTIWKDCRLYALMYNTEHLFLSTGKKNTAMWSVCAQSFCCVAFIPGKVHPSSVIPDVWISILFDGKPKAATAAPLSSQPQCFFPFVSRLHIGVWCMDWVNMSQDHTCARWLQSCCSVSHTLIGKGRSALHAISTNKQS